MTENVRRDACWHGYSRGSVLVWGQPEAVGICGVSRLAGYMM